MSVRAVVLTLESADETWTRDSGAGDTETFAPHWPAILPHLEALAPRVLTGATVLLRVTITPGTVLDISPGQLALLTLAQCGLRVETA